MRLPILSLLTFVGLGAFAFSSAQADGLSNSDTRFVYVDRNGKVQSTKIISSYTGKLTTSLFPASRSDPDPCRYHCRGARACTFAEELLALRERGFAWQSGAVDSYPQTALARQAGDELVSRYGFKRLATRDPYQAPVGSVLVYGSGRAAGHVEIRTAHGFASDFRTPTPSRRPLIGILREGLFGAGNFDVLERRRVPRQGTSRSSPARCSSLASVPARLPNNAPQLALTRGDQPFAADHFTRKSSDNRTEEQARQSKE